MANTVTNVTQGKPAVGGAVYCAPTGTALPTDAVSTLNSAFKCLGYCSEDGVTNNQALETEDVKAWGGDVVLNLQTSFTDTFALTLIESMNIDVLQAIYGTTNATGALATGITTKVGSQAKPELSWVIDMILRGNVVKRVVIPFGQITELGEIAYNDSSAVGYPVTIGASADSSGYSHYEYTKAPATTP